MDLARREADQQFAEDVRHRAEATSRELGVSFTFIAASGDPFTELCRIATNHPL
jgi:hypothetical protein